MTEPDTFNQDLQLLSKLMMFAAVTYMDIPPRMSGLEEINRILNQGRQPLDANVVSMIFSTLYFVEYRFENKSMSFNTAADKVYDKLQLLGNPESFANQTQVRQNVQESIRVLQAQGITPTSTGLRFVPTATGPHAVLLLAALIVHIIIDGTDDLKNELFAPRFASIHSLLLEIDHDANEQLPDFTRKNALHSIRGWLEYTQPGMEQFRSLFRFLGSKFTYSIELNNDKLQHIIQPRETTGPTTSARTLEEFRKRSTTGKRPNVVGGKRKKTKRRASKRKISTSWRILF